MTDYEKQADLMKMLYANIQSNERLRNNLFALYMAIVAAFYGFSNQAFPGVDPASTNALLSSLVWGVGVLFLGAFIRYKEMIRRDVDLAFLLQESLFKDHPGLLELFHQHCDRVNTKHRRVTSVSTALVALTLVVSIVVLAMLLLSLFGGSAWWEALGLYISISFAVNLAVFLAYGGSHETFSDHVAVGSQPSQDVPA